MKLTLKRSGEVKSFEAILTMEWFSPERIDIVELLTFIKENGGMVSTENLKPVMGEVPDSIINGVINHLKNVGFVHPHGLISKKGNLIVETRKVPIEEKGQFKFYYIQDALLENYLLDYVRSTKVVNNDKIETLNMKTYLDKKYTSVVNSYEFQIKSFDSVSRTVYLDDNSGKYQLEWAIDLSKTNPSRMFLSGELYAFYKNGKQKFQNKEIAVGVKIDPYQFINVIIKRVLKEGMEWDEVRKILLVPFDKVKEEELITLTTSLKINDLGEEEIFKGFGPSEITSIPIGPRNSREAKKWIITLAKKFLQDGYKHESELFLYLDGLKEKNAFSSYEDIIDNIKLEEISNEIKLQEDYQAYWNLQAPIDLFLELDEKFIIRNKRLDIAAGTKLSMSELIDEFVNNEIPDTLVFSSKYIKNPSQVRKFELFVKAFKAKGVENILLVTKHQTNFQDKDIKIETYENVYSGSIPPHDRYFAFRTNGKWHRYKMSAELDQCRFESVNVSEANEHTRGSWQDISFMEIKSEVFPQKLNEQLSMMEEVYYL